MIALIRNIIPKWILAIMVIWFLLGFFSHFIANDKPIFANQGGRYSFPVLEEIFLDKEFSPRYFKNQSLTFAIWPPIPYSPNEQDLLNQGVGPFQVQANSSIFQRHWLGTDHLGRDVFAHLIHGLRVDLGIGVFSMLIAALIGLIIGLNSGFWGDNRLRLNLLQIIFAIIAIPLLIFWIGYSANADSGFVHFIIALFILLVYGTIHYFLGRFPKIKTRTIPLDILTMRGIEIFVSIPTIFLILFLIGIFNSQSFWTLVLIIGLTRWTGLARLARAEVLKVKESEFVQNAKVLGFSHQRIIIKHILPNILPPLLVNLSFGVAGAILIEGFLSYIGLGLPADTASWGKLLNSGQNHLNYWWLSVFPGLAIFGTVLVLNILGDRISRAHKSNSSS